MQAHKTLAACKPEWPGRAQGGMLLSASYVILWLAQHAWDYAVEVRCVRGPTLGTVWHTPSPQSLSLYPTSS